jgi:hypothetical protein
MACIWGIAGEGLIDTTRIRVATVDGTLIGIIAGDGYVLTSKVRDTRVIGTVITVITRHSDMLASG